MGVFTKVFYSATDKHFMKVGKIINQTLSATQKLKQILDEGSKPKQVRKVLKNDEQIQKAAQLKNASPSKYASMVQIIIKKLNSLD